MSSFFCRSIWYAVVLLWGTILLGPLSGCFVEEQPDEELEDDRPFIVRPGPTREAPRGDGNVDTVTPCTDQIRGLYSVDDTPPASSCYQQPGNQTQASHVYWTNCSGGDCERLQIEVSYMLSENLGTNQTVVIEAFDNPWFKGYPLSSLRMTGFDASFAGAATQDVLLIAPGEYFLRAYIAPDLGPPVPFEYEGMEFVSEQPFGIYGAGSDASRVLVGHSGTETEPQTIAISLNHLFQNPTEAAATAAHIRVILHAAPEVEIPTSQNIVIRLHENEDFSYDPAYKFLLPTETLLVEQQPGRAEFLSDALAPGTYYLSAFVDVSGNGFHDAGEPWALHVGEQMGENPPELPASIFVDRNRTISIELNLTIPEGMQP